MSRNTIFMISLATSLTFIVTCYGLQTWMLVSNALYH